MLSYWILLIVGVVTVKCGTEHYCDWTVELVERSFLESPIVFRGKVRNVTNIDADYIVHLEECVYYKGCVSTEVQVWGFGTGIDEDHCQDEPPEIGNEIVVFATAGAGYVYLNFRGNRTVLSDCREYLDMCQPGERVIHENHLKCIAGIEPGNFIDQGVCNYSSLTIPCTGCNCDLSIEQIVCPDNSNATSTCEEVIPEVCSTVWDCFNKSFDDCWVGGCSDEICSEKQDTINSPCSEWICDYGCYKHWLTCKKNQSGMCAWLNNNFQEEYDQCLERCRTESPHYNLPRDFCSCMVTDNSGWCLISMSDYTGREIVWGKCLPKGMMEKCMNSMDSGGYGGKWVNGEKKCTTIDKKESGNELVDKINRIDESTFQIILEQVSNQSTDLILNVQSILEATVDETDANLGKVLF